jgi:hypothetical protein
VSFAKALPQDTLSEHGQFVGSPTSSLTGGDGHDDKALFDEFAKVMPAFFDSLSPNGQMLTDREIREGANA